MTCSPIVRRAIRRTRRHFRRHGVFHGAVALAVGCIGVPVGLLMLLPPSATAPAFMAPVPVPEPAMWLVFPVPFAVLALIRRK